MTRNNRAAPVIRADRRRVVRVPTISQQRCDAITEAAVYAGGVEAVLAINKRAGDFSVVIATPYMHANGVPDFVQRLAELADAIEKERRSDADSG